MSTAMVLIFHYLKEDRLKMSAAYLALSCTFLQGIYLMKFVYTKSPPMDDGFRIAYYFIV